MTEANEVKLAATQKVGVPFEVEEVKAASLRT